MSERKMKLLEKIVLIKKQLRTLQEEHGDFAVRKACKQWRQEVLHFKSTAKYNENRKLKSVWIKAFGESK